MIYNVRGTLTYTDINYAVVECGGVGFKCFVSMTTLKELPPLGKEANLYTYLSVREDAMDLFGFATQQELDAFKLLITVSGVGPKAAMAVLSVLPPDRLSIAVSSGDVKSIQSAQGVGKKRQSVLFSSLRIKCSESLPQTPPLFKVFRLSPQIPMRRRQLRFLFHSDLTSQTLQRLSALWIKACRLTI